MSLLNPHGSDETAYVEFDDGEREKLLNPHGSDETKNRKIYQQEVKKTS